MKPVASVVKGVAIHVVVLFLVAITPPLWYDFWREHYSSQDFLYAGGIVWVPYVGYWLFKLSRNWPGTAAILTHLSTIVLAFAVATLMRVGSRHELTLCSIPVVVASLGGVGALILNWRRPQAWTRKWAWGVLITVPFGVLCSGTLLLGLAMSHGPLRY